MMRRVLVIAFVLVWIPVSALRSDPLVEDVTITLQPGQTFTAASPVITVTGGAMAVTASFATTPPPPDTTAPVISAFTVTANGKSKNVTANVTASDAVGVVRVDVLVDGVVKASLVASPWTVVLSNKTGGTHRYEAVAVDAAGNRSLTAVVTR